MTLPEFVFKRLFPLHECQIEEKKGIIRAFNSLCEVRYNPEAKILLANTWIGTQYGSRQVLWLKGKEIDAMFPWVEQNDETPDGFFTTDFHSDMDDYIESAFYSDEETIKSLPEGWKEKIFWAKSEPVCQLDKRDIVGLIMEHIGNRFEYRFPEHYEQTDKKLTEAIEKCIDIEKLNILMPKLFYPGEAGEITKQDLIDAL